MVLKKWQLKLMLNGFPALFFQRVRIRKIHPGFRRFDVRVRRSVCNKNLARTIFGGTIFSAADPYFAIMYWQILEHAGIPAVAWLKSASIDYLRPAATDLDLTFELSETDIAEAERGLREHGRHEKWHTVRAVDVNGHVCAEIRTLIHIRPPRTKKGAATKTNHLRPNP
jgi:acyl-coenzyme A thioesterase PaaI-like protein